jgi:hypothetical protein
LNNSTSTCVVPAFTGTLHADCSPAVTTSQSMAIDTPSTGDCVGTSVGSGGPGVDVGSGVGVTVGAVATAENV